MFYVKLAGALALAGLMVAVNMLYSANQALKKDVTQLEDAAVGLNGVIKIQSKAIDLSRESISKLEIANGKIRSESDGLISDLSKLRATETQRSLEAPFEAGGDADARRRAILLRFTGSRPGNRTGGEDQGSDSIGTISP